VAVGDRPPRGPLVGVHAERVDHGRETAGEPARHDLVEELERVLRRAEVVRTGADHGAQAVGGHGALVAEPRRRRRSTPASMAHARHTVDVPVSPEDRAKWERQVAALREEESDDEGTPQERWAYIQWANAERVRRGLPELETEGEVHWIARTLGLLDGIPRSARRAR